MMGFIEKLKRKRAVDKYSKQAKSLGDSLYDGQAMLIQNDGGRVRVHTLEDVDARECDEVSMPYADVAKYARITPSSAIEIHASLSTPPWLEHLFEEAE